MPSSTQASGGAVSQLPIPERKPDYFIGTTGRPILTSHFTAMHRTDRLNESKSDNVVTNSKLNKCLHNLKVRNGGGGGGGAIPIGNSDRHGSIVTSSRRVSNKNENDITTIPKYSTTGGRCSVALPHISGSTRASDAGRYSIGPASGWCSIANAHQKSGSYCGSPTDRSRSSTSPTSARLLAARSSMQQYRPNTTSTKRSSRGSPEVADSSLVLQQPCRYSNHYKLLDNRLTNQRSYDRNIFGYDQRMDQFVLPPLQI
ncbi:uncharacterized protein LOC128711208 [Anopheles marshallii]|uniref:uncharacterized protein LOC128711208 n=1 Tax=Anopheles marshallii TaxID=1521116 RepID=UPI00237A70D5|nr:uncharacterized protein LOC128711208 [Anopheles marshallii]